jgi:hypothetical protein
MAELFLSFIQRAKKRSWTVEEMASRLAEHPDPEPRNRIFHQLALRAYGEYEQLLGAGNAMDFDDLMAMAADEVLANGAAATIALSQDKVVAIRDLRWLLLDEFQDFSELYFRLIDAIRKANPDIRLVAVGDDWQAINSFAGAQLKFFEKFADYFPAAGRVGISTNYRSAGMIVGAGNRIMAGRGAPALANEPSLKGRRSTCGPSINASSSFDPCLSMETLAGVMRCSSLERPSLRENRRPRAFDHSATGGTGAQGMRRVHHCFGVARSQRPTQSGQRAHSVAYRLRLRLGVVRVRAETSLDTRSASRVGESRQQCGLECDDGAQGQGKRG